MGIWVRACVYIYVCVVGTHLGAYLGATTHACVCIHSEHRLVSEMSNHETAVIRVISVERLAQFQRCDYRHT